MSQAKHNLIHKCSFNGKPCDIDKDFELVADPTFGNCFVFNHDRKEQKSSLRAGPQYGLRVMLYVNASDYLPTSEAVGIRLTIHDKEDFPFPDTFGYSAPTGYISSFGMRMKKMSRLPAPYGDCIESGATSNYIYKGYAYSTEGCYRTCFQELIIDRCGCSDPRFPTIGETMPCEVFNKAHRDCLEKHTHEVSEVHSSFKCRCQQPCNQTVYTTSYSEAIWPSQALNISLGHCEKTPEECNEEYQDDAAMLEVFYEALNFEVLTESEAYGIVKMMADFGGHLGLWSGVSVMTICEFVCLWCCDFRGGGAFLHRDTEEGFREERQVQKLDNKSCRRAGQRFDPVAMLTEWLYWLLIFLFFSGSLFLLHIPLPHDIADRKKLTVAEFLLRIFNEYVGDMLESVCGPERRNKLTRHVVAAGFILPQLPPDNIERKVCKLGGVKVITYNPESKKSDGVLVFIHGGGWATGRAKFYDSIMYELVNRLGVCAVSVEYRLAPENPYPAGLDDCEAVIWHLYRIGCEGLSFDKEKIVVVGDSAGGNLVAAVCQRIARQNEKFVKAQILIYPVIHVFNFSSPSYQEYYQKYGGTGLLNPRQMARWILFYLGIPATQDNIKKVTHNQHLEESYENSAKFEEMLGLETLPDEFTEHYIPPKRRAVDNELAKNFTKLGTNPEVSPIFGVTSDLPPALVITAGYDVLRDEGVQYVTRLRKFGVPTEWKHFPQGFHGLFNMPHSEEKNKMMIEVVNFAQKHV
ncbi:unnamed protein product [Caenorhabditis auriculariae]|uniref:Alpha/beta hydrolase fold-3 domain-containing protein n=1 Tax=Caenorhabditis auriculariae TaxID=2777116 RepID=A0A8S1GUN7_9PELO|nr:unnamed protein product [Caenorhabditis auriculariae]